MYLLYTVFFNFHSLLFFSSLSSFVSLPSPLLSLRLELTERQLLLTRTALDNALKDLNQMKYISLCLSSFTLILLIPLFLCLLVLIFYFHCFTFLLLFFFYFLFLFSFFYFRETMRELTTSNTDADATMETGVEERDSYYSNYAHHGIHEEMLKVHVILHVCDCMCDCAFKCMYMYMYISSAAIQRENNLKSFQASLLIQ